MKICIPIKEKTVSKVLKILSEASERADLAEVWLDGIKEPDHKKIFSDAPLPLVACCKRRQEKGSFTGSYEAQAEILINAIKYGAKYVDIPLFMPEKLNKKIVQSAHKAGVKVIISHHDFEKTPDFRQMLRICKKMSERGADIVKIAVKNKVVSDAIEVISVGKVMQGQKRPHILIGMGQKGILTRILTPTLSGEMMFAVLDKKRQTAEGQMTVDELKEAWKLIKAK